MTAVERTNTNAVLHNAEALNRDAQTCIKRGATLAIVGATATVAGIGSYMLSNYPWMSAALTLAGAAASGVGTAVAITGVTCGAVNLLLSSTMLSAAGAADTASTLKSE